MTALIIILWSIFAGGMVVGCYLTAAWILRRPHDLHETEDFSDGDCRPASLLGQPIDAFRDRGA